MYLRSNSTVDSLNLYCLPLCCLCPSTVIIPCSVSMCFSLVQCSSIPSKPDSRSILKTVEELNVGADVIIVFACSLVGVIGTGKSYLYLGLVHVNPLALTK